ncbi:hypothetical protein Nepgr_012958 [Nepenthes gracilis]|uniref:Uncharacterized protein n=1 Tax=Nepenthes gracilis TaxID=150966 RepID=A0AAD3SI69_NEPGR|nr:hypothetical protein Nepgr_012958 [Nepenthes gracilis]
MSVLEHLSVLPQSHTLGKGNGVVGVGGCPWLVGVSLTFCCCHWSLCAPNDVIGLVTAVPIIVMESSQLDSSFTLLFVLVSHVPFPS